MNYNLVLLASTKCSKTSKTADPNNSPGFTETVKRIFLQVSDKGECVSPTYWQVQSEPEST